MLKHRFPHTNGVRSNAMNGTKVRISINTEVKTRRADHGRQTVKIWPEQHRQTCGHCPIAQGNVVMSDELDWKWQNRLARDL